MNNPRWVQMRKDARKRWSRAYDLREAGKTYREIGEEFGVTIERARQLVANHIRVNRIGREPPRKSGNQPEQGDMIGLPAFMRRENRWT